MVDLVTTLNLTMNKSTHFSGQPTFTQLVKFIPREIINRCAKKHQSNRYYKRFDTFHHLVAMLFNCFGHCNSLRECVTGMAALEGRLSSCGIKHFPTRSTFADANAKRDSEVFAEIYFELKNYWDQFFPDSRKRSKKPTFIIDSTTITLFQEIFKGAGMRSYNGKRKGGLKVHMAVQETQSVPSIIHLTQAASNDKVFNEYLNFPSGSTVIMDRGYRSHTQYNQWTANHVRWVTRLHPYSVYRVKHRLNVNEKQRQLGVQNDLLVTLGAELSKAQKVQCRLIKFKSLDNGRAFEFITNDVKSTPSYICDLYKKRWSIELLFKRLKQNMPLEYFLGDNQNAIKIQVWCTLIADLLLQIVKRQVKRPWAFSNIVSIVRLHLFNYLDLFSFLEHPEKCIIRTTPEDFQLKLSLSGSPPFKK